MSTPASEVFSLEKDRRPQPRRLFSWLGFWIGALLSMGDAGVLPPGRDQINIIRLADGSTASTYAEGFEPPAMYDALAKDLAAMTADEFERQWVH